MANRHRGEISAHLGGRDRTLVLTLGALAELEAAFAVEDLTALAERFGRGRLCASDMVRLIGAGVRGGGETIDDEEVARLVCPEGAVGYARIVSALLSGTFGGGEAPRPPVPQET